MANYITMLHNVYQGVEEYLDAALAFPSTVNSLRIF